MFDSRRDEGCVSLLERHGVVGDLERPAAGEHDVHLVPVVRLLAIGLWRYEHVDAELEALGLVDDLVAALALLEAALDVPDANRIHGDEPIPRRRARARPGARGRPGPGTGGGGPRPRAGGGCGRWSARDGRALHLHRHDGARTIRTEEAASWATRSETDPSALIP